MAALNRLTRAAWLPQLCLVTHCCRTALESRVHTSQVRAGTPAPYCPSSTPRLILCGVLSVCLALLLVSFSWFLALAPFCVQKMQEFFYPELKSTFGLQRDDQNPQLYRIDDEGVTLVSWQAEGGLILGRTDDGVRVIWLDDAPKHLLRASGLSALGVPFKQEWNPDKACS